MTDVTVPAGGVDRPQRLTKRWLHVLATTNPPRAPIPVTCPDADHAFGNAGNNSITPGREYSTMSNIAVGVPKFASIWNATLVLLRLYMSKKFAAAPLLKSTDGVSTSPTSW